MLLKLPVGFSYRAMGEHYGLDEGFTVHDVIEAIAGGGKPVKKPSAFQKQVSKKPRKDRPEVLADQHRILTEMGKFYLATQNIQVDADYKKGIIERNFKNPGRKPEEPPLF